MNGTDTAAREAVVVGAMAEAMRLLDWSDRGPTLGELAAAALEAALSERECELCGGDGGGTEDDGTPNPWATCTVCHGSPRRLLVWGDDLGRAARALGDIEHELAVTRLGPEFIPAVARVRRKLDAVFTERNEQEG